MDSEKALVESQPQPSRGARKMDNLLERIEFSRTKYLVLLYGSFILLAYVISLDTYVSPTFLTTATSVSFAAHSKLTTIKALTSVFRAVSQPPIALIADRIGRVEAYGLCLVLYIIGYIVVATSQDIINYAVGSILHIVGLTGLLLMQNIIVSGISSLRSRLFWLSLPCLPGIINIYISGSFASSILKDGNPLNSWRWGYGLFAILTPVISIPLISTLTVGMRDKSNFSFKSLLGGFHSSQATITDDSTVIEYDGAISSWRSTLISIWFDLDVVGMVLFLVGAGAFLVAITLAGNLNPWNSPAQITLLTIGSCLFIGWIFWEFFGARKPMIAVRTPIFRNKTVILLLLTAALHPCANAAVNAYYFTFLEVAAENSVASATRISTITDFGQALVSVLAGILVRYTRKLKPIIVFGFVCFTLGLGLMYRFEGTSNSRAELVLVTAVRSIGLGLVALPVQAAIQSVTPKDEIFSITASYLAIFYLSSGVGSAIGGAIWTNTLPNKLNSLISNSTIAAAAYSDPISFISIYGDGTPERIALARGQSDTFHVIVIVATVISFIATILTLFIQDITLSEKLADDSNSTIGSTDFSEKASKEEQVIS